MKTAVLLMAYGSPRNSGEVEAYFTDIRGGRPPSSEALQKLNARYAAIGGNSGLNQITQRQAAALAEHLGPSFAVFVGMKHWHPFIRDAVEQIVDEGFDKIVGLVLAPYFSSKSVGEYETRIQGALGARGVAVTMVKSWYDEPAFVDLVADNLREALTGWDEARVFFTAHSIPARIVESGDPYREQLADSAKLYAEAASLGDYEIAWQSASATGEPWIGPDIADSLELFGASGGARAVIAPVGFVSDHLEILYDIDLEAKQGAEALGIELRRIRSPNDDPRFIAALGNIVMRYAHLS